MDRTNRNDKTKAWILFVFLAYPALYTCLNSVIGLADVAHVMLVLAVYVPLAFIFLVKKEAVDIVYLIFAFAIVLLFTVYKVVTINTSYYLEDYALPSCVTFFSGIIGFYIVAIQRNEILVRQALKIATVILVVYGLWYSFDINNKASYQWGYDMFLGYLMLLPGILSLNFLLNDFITTKLWEKVLWSGVVFSTILVILAFGSRGPFIGILVFLLIRFTMIWLPRPDLSQFKKVLLTLAVVVGAIVLIVEFDNIINLVSKSFNSLGISSRTITKLMGGSIGYDNGRIQFFNEIINQINIVGHGPFFDQYVYGKGNYCHNFLLEVFYDFGIIIGSLILIFLLVQLYRIVRYNYRSKWFDLFICFFSYCFGRLSLSGTFWSETNFWMMLGFAFLCIRDINRRCRTK